MILSFTWCLLLFLSFECKYQHTMDSENRLDLKTQTLLQTRIVDFCCSLLLIGHRALNVLCLFKANSSRGWKWKEIKMDQATWARLDFNWLSTKLLTRRRSGGLICGKVGWLDIPAVCMIGLLSQRMLCCFVISFGNDWRCLRRMLEYFQWFSKGTRTRYLEKRWVNAVKSQPTLPVRSLHHHKAEAGRNIQHTVHYYWDSATDTTFKTRISHFNLREDARAAYWSYLSRKTEYSCMKETNWREKMLQIQPLQKGLINKCMLTNTSAHMHILHVI